MAELVEVTMADILRDLPEAVPWQSSNVADSRIDVLVCCAGFEDRARAILIDSRDMIVKNAVIIVYPTNREDNEAALEDFRKQESFENRIELTYDRRTFLKSVRDVFTEIRDVSAPRIVVDLSGMASYVVYRVLDSCFDLFPEGEVGIYYSEAENYSPSHTEWEKFFQSVSNPDDNLAMAERYEETYFQSVGVDETYESDVAPGLNTDPLVTQLVAIPSFSLQRMKSMLAFAQSHYSVPSGNIRWFLGQPPDRKRNGWRYDAMASLYNVKNDGVAVSTLNYRETLQELDELWQESHTESHTVIANMGSKMQHLGVFLFLRMHPESGLLLCEPESFLASSYSTGCGAKWWLDFGQVGKLNSILKSRGMLRFTW